MRWTQPEDFDKMNNRIKIKLESTKSEQEKYHQKDITANYASTSRAVINITKNPNLWRHTYKNLQNFLNWKITIDELENISEIETDLFSQLLLPENIRFITKKKIMKEILWN